MTAKKKSAELDRTPREKALENAFVDGDDKDELVHGIPTSELWSLDATLTEYILPRIKAFRTMKRHGYPVLVKDIKTDRDYSSDPDECEEAEWENILFDIEKGFEAHSNLISGASWRDGDGSYSNKEENEAQRMMEKGLSLFAKHYFQLWD